MPRRGNRARFATTHWSLVLAAGGERFPAAEEALAKLCETYWYPLYAFLRGRGHSADDAQDLTQAFFVHLLENKALRQADPARGRFRSFLLTSLKNFAANEHDRELARKRGGGASSRRTRTISGESWDCPWLAIGTARGTTRANHPGVCRGADSKVVARRLHVTPVLQGMRRCSQLCDSS